MSEKVKHICEICGNVFFVRQSLMNHYLKKGIPNRRFCSKKCKDVSQTTSTDVNCSYCGKDINVRSCCLTKSKTKRFYCSKSCAATYNNTHKITGNRRSKLEIFLQKQLTLLYPNLKIEYNKTNAINSELDIYISSLKLAFEINGIYHFKPIHGPELLKKIVDYDNRKLQACSDQGIDLCVVDSSKMAHFSEKASKEYLEVISNAIQLKIGTP